MPFETMTNDEILAYRNKLHADALKAVAYGGGESIIPFMSLIAEANEWLADRGVIPMTTL